MSGTPTTVETTPVVRHAPVLPPLMRDPSLWAIVVTQFLGAYNDNLFKQIVLLLAAHIVKAQVALQTVGGQVSGEPRDVQGIAMIVFAAPFILCSGLAGYLSDRYRKRTVIVSCKVAEIVVMFLGLCAFVWFDALGMPGLLVVLGLMATHSAFFGPGKYGVLPEMLRAGDLPRANGIMMMTTFLAIIFGTATAGFFTDHRLHAPGAETWAVDRLWVSSAFGIGIAVVGTLTALPLRPTEPADPHLRWRWPSLAVPGTMRRLLWADRPLAKALMASCAFWMVAGLSHLTVNALGVHQLQVSDLKTSVLAALIGVGIAMGSVLAGRLSREPSDFRITRVGAGGIVLALFLLSLTRQDGEHLLGYWGSLPVMVLLGAAAGAFALPVQVFLQSRPPAHQKGQLIAVMNQANFLAIGVAGGGYALLTRLAEQYDWPRSWLFAVTAVIMLPVAIGYRGKGTDSKGMHEWE